jgi:hypothetical protein
MSDAEQTWRTFRRFKYPGITIAETAEAIIFTQRNGVSWKRRYLVNALTAVMVIVPAFLMLNQRGATDGLYWPFWTVMLLYFCVGLPLLTNLYVWINTHVIVAKDSVTVEADRTYPIPFPELSNIDVRPQGNRYWVTIWHGPVRIPTLAIAHEPDAISLREGVLTAIKLKQQQGSRVARKRSKTFAE